MIFSQILLLNLDLSLRFSFKMFSIPSILKLRHHFASSSDLRRCQHWSFHMLEMLRCTQEHRHSCLKNEWSDEDVDSMVEVVVSGGWSLWDRAIHAIYEIFYGIFKMALKNEERKDKEEILSPIISNLMSFFKFTTMINQGNSLSKKQENNPVKNIQYKRATKDKFLLSFMRNYFI